MHEPQASNLARQHFLSLGLRNPKLYSVRAPIMCTTCDSRTLAHRCSGVHVREKYIGEMQLCQYSRGLMPRKTHFVPDHQAQSIDVCGGRFDPTLCWRTFIGASSLVVVGNSLVNHLWVRYCERRKCPCCYSVFFLREQLKQSLVVEALEVFSPFMELFS